MTASFPINQGLTQAQWESWFTSFTTSNPNVPKTYTGNNAAAKGKTWSQTYAAEAASSPGLSPDELAEATYILIQDEAFANGVDATAQAAWSMPAISVASAVAGASQVANSVPGLSDVLSISNFLGALTSANLWIRVAKVVAGGAILITGLAKLTGMDQKAGSLAGKAVKAAPFL